MNTLQHRQSAPRRQGSHSNSSSMFPCHSYAAGERSHGTTFLANHLKLDQRENLASLLEVCRAVAQKVSGHGTPKPHPTAAHIMGSAEEPMFLPERVGFGLGTEEQHQQLARLIGVSVEAVNWAVGRGVLVFGDWHGQQCYGVCDSSGRLFELRRLNGLNFPAVGDLQARKSHRVKHSQANWPVGLPEAKRAANLLLVEGLADFIAAHELIVANQLEDQWAPIAMLSAGVSISRDALPGFNGKEVLICVHNAPEHQVGQAALNWHRQLQSAGSTKISLLDARKMSDLAGGGIKDLNDHPSPTPVRELGWRQWLRNQLQHWGLKFNGLSHPALNH
jgi:hypothetical protein